MANDTINLENLDINTRAALPADFGSGIKLAAGFDLGSAIALDSRFTVQTIEERNEHVTNNRAYEGMPVYVRDTKKIYFYRGSDWKELGAGSEEIISSIINDLITGGTDKALSAEQGKVLKGLIDAANAAITKETQDRTAADTTLQGHIDTLKGQVDGISTDWAGVTNKPFEALGDTLKVAQDSKKLDVKVDGDTIQAKADGALEVKDGVFAHANHNHDEAYASKSHEQNTGIHLTSGEKTDVAKIPTLVNEVDVLKSSLSASSKHHIVMTKAEMLALQNTNHGDVCHVIEEATTYILDKNDIDGDSVNPEWIKVSDFNSITSVDWSIVNNKPFTTIGAGLIAEGGAIKVVADGSTVEIVDGKIKVKSGVFAEANHTHQVDWSEILNKPTPYRGQLTEASWTAGEGNDVGLFYATISHGKGTDEVDVKVYGADKIERLVAVELVNDNSIKIWSDTAEIVSVRVYPLAVDNPNTHSAIVGLAKVGQAIVGK